jgi:hypothetical protein
MDCGFVLVALSLSISAYTILRSQIATAKDVRVV